jgi:hypothetical protein
VRTGNITSHAKDNISSAPPEERHRKKIGRIDGAHRDRGREGERARERGGKGDRGKETETQGTRQVE